jgi:pimeloyl-ACP methyl ester carboxylesterase
MRSGITDAGRCRRKRGSRVGIAYAIESSHVLRSYGRADLAWEALITSRDAFPLVRREDVQRLTVPALMLSGGNSYSVGKLIDAELERVLPNTRRVIVPQATHEICQEQPVACVEAIRAFLVSQQAP